MYKGKKILALIPARAGSKGVPFKNFKKLNGKPLIHYTLESAVKSNYIDKVFVSTDSEDILNYSNKLFNLNLNSLRPKHLSGDKATSLSVIIYSLKYLLKNNLSFDAVVLLQPTVPFRKNNFIDESIETFYKSKSDSLISVIPVPEKYNPYWTFINKNKDYLKYAVPQKKIISRRQNLPESYIRDGSVYITKSDVLMKFNSLYGEKIGFIINDEKFNINIDNMDDWKKAEKFIKDINK